MQQTARKNMARIPMPMPEELSSLPPLAIGLLETVKNEIPVKDYKTLARVFVDAVNGDLPTLNKTSLKYQNPRLLRFLNAISDMGEYNPDKIAISTYEKMALDPQIIFATALVELPILVQNYRIVSQDEQQAAVVEESMKIIYRQLVKSMIKAYRYGFAVGEKIYDLTKMKITRTDEDGDEELVYNDWALIIKKVKFAHPSSIKIIRDPKTEDIKYVTQRYDYFTTGLSSIPRKINIKKCVWFAPDAEYGNFFGEARYKAAYPAWYFGQIILQFMMSYLERRGSPSVVAKAPPGTSVNSENVKVDNLTLAMQMGQSLISNSVIAMPQVFDKNTGKPLWEAEYLEDKQRGDLFISVLTYLNTMKMRALLVPDKVGSSDGRGGNSTSESHTDVHMLNLEAMIQIIEDNINNQVIPDLINYNFQANKRRPCYIKIERLNHSKRTLYKDVFTRMLMLASGSIRDGRPPVWAPSLKQMADFLEIPGDDFNKIFSLIVSPDGSSGDNDQDVDNIDDNADKEDDTLLDKQQNKKDQNKKAVPRKERTRRDRRSRERM